MYINNQGYSSINDLRMYVETIPKDSNSETVHTYRLYVWITKEIRVGNAPQVDYTLEEWNNLFANVKVKVVGDFVEKEKEDVIKVTFDANGGTVSPGFKYYHEGDTYGELPTPVREGYTFMGWEYNPLPSEYQEVEYIESTGTQYISPGITTDSGVYWYAKFSITKLLGDGYEHYNTIIGQTGLPQIAIGYNVWSVGNRYISIPFAPVADTIYEATLNEDGLGSLYINNQDTTLKRTGVVSPRILSNDSGGTYAKLYSAKFINRTTNDAIANFIPCYRKSDNVAGLYDLVNSEFYTNRGTGTFIVGEDVSLAYSQVATQVTSNTQVITNEDHTLYAIWQYNPKVTFDANGGIVNISSKRINYNENYGELPIPLREGYTFTGWEYRGLPAGYQEVEYIESTGTQYISPGITTDSSIYWLAKFSITKMQGAVTAYYNTIVGTDGAPQIAVSASGWTVGNAGSTNPFIPVENEIYEATMNSDGLGTLMVNNQSTGLRRTGVTTPSILGGYGTYARIYSVKFINRTTNDAIANFVPCYRKNGDVAGLYDLVNGVFYTNQGEGTFIVGNDISPADYQVAIQVNSNTQVKTNEDHTLYAIWKLNE